MEHINEKYISLSLIPPQSVAAAGNVTGSFVSIQSRKRLCVCVQMGTVAAEKSVKMEIMTSTTEDGTDATVYQEVTYTAPTGGVASHVEEIPLLVRHDMGPYLTVKVTNEGAAAVLASALLVADSAFYPEPRPADPASA